MHEPAIAWWAPHVIKKRDHIISKVKARTKKKGSKYGIRIPSTVAEAHHLDKENENTSWADAIKDEMSNIRIAFDIFEKDKVIEPGRIFLE